MLGKSQMRIVELLWPVARSRPSGENAAAPHGNVTALPEDTSSPVRRSHSRNSPAFMYSGNATTARCEALGEKAISRTAYECFHVPKSRPVAMSHSRTD